MSRRDASKSFRHVGAIRVIHALDRSRSMLNLAADRIAKFFRGSAQGCAADQWDVIRARAGPRGRLQRLHRNRDMNVIAKASRKTRILLGSRHPCHGDRSVLGADAGAYQGSESESATDSMMECGLH